MTIDMAARVRAVIDKDMNQSARALQSAERLIGPSEVGGCRAYLAHMIAGTRVDQDYDDIKWAAFVGTYVGAGIEAGLAAMYDDVRTQVPLTATLPSGLQVSGNCDIVVLGDGIYDLKSKDGLSLVRRYPPSLQYLIQTNIYLKGAIEQGLVPPDGTWNLVYVDRSGRDDTPHVVSGTLDSDVLAIADSRLEDALYAAEHNLDDAPRDMPMDFCLGYCLTGDTEVVTRQGIRPIRDLAMDGTAELLVPARQRETGMTWHGQFSIEKVQSFGIQPVRTITLGRGRQRKVVRATPEHQWFVRETGSHVRTQEIKRTADLQPGDVLRSIRKNIGTPDAIRVAQMQGYVYGDGHRNGTASCSVNVYTNGGDNIEMARSLFVGQPERSRKDGITFSGLPSLWKDAPDLRESPQYLLSWLSGYFAADGYISAEGQCSISSASRASVDLVRSVCAIVGVGYGPVQRKLRVGFPEAEESELFTLNIRRADLPEWFFLRPTQRRRAWPKGKKQEENYHRTREAGRDWKVVSVEDHGETEEVFCAIVDDVEAFALADGLLTHNCPFVSSCRGKDEHQVEGLITNADHLTAAQGYRDGLAMEREGKKLKDEAKAVLTGISGSTGEYEISWTWVDETQMPATTRAGYNRMTLRKVPTKKIGAKK